MIFYTFRCVYQGRSVDLYECTKWSDIEREPVDVYTIRVKPRSMSCNCYAYSKCKHMELVREIIDSGLSGELRHYLWDITNTWQFIDDMVDA